MFDPLLKLSIFIKIARLKRGLTQTQMAKKMGIRLLPYQRLESGTNRRTDRDSYPVPFGYAPFGSGPIWVKFPPCLRSAQKFRKVYNSS